MKKKWDRPIIYRVRVYEKQGRVKNWKVQGKNRRTWQLWSQKSSKFVGRHLWTFHLGSLSIHQSPVKSFLQKSGFATLLEADLTRKGCIMLCQTECYQKLKTLMHDSGTVESCHYISCGLVLRLRLKRLHTTKGMGKTFLFKSYTL